MLNCHNGRDDFRNEIKATESLLSRVSENNLQDKIRRAIRHFTNEEIPSGLRGVTCLRARVIGENDLVRQRTGTRLTILLLYAVAKKYSCLRGSYFRLMKDTSYVKFQRENVNGYWCINLVVLYFNLRYMNYVHGKY